MSASITGCTLAGVVGSDDVSCTGSNGQFSDASAGLGKTVTADVALSGGDAGNYSVAATATTLADITKAALTVSGITANDKVYDRTTGAALNTGSASLVGVIGSDDVSLSTGSAVGTFDTKDVGAGKTVSISGLTISGAQAADYTLAQPSTTASITKLYLTVTGITADNKIYDATTTATLNTGLAALNGVISPDTVSLDASGASGAFSSKTVGTGKTVQVSGLTIGGADVANYGITQPTATADITARTLTVSGITASDKIYDGGTSAALNTGSAALVGIQGSDSVSLNTGAAVGTFDTKNVGSGKSVSVSGLTISGTDAGNYSLSQPSTTAAITPKSLTAAITASNRIYDGTASASITGCSLTGVISPDAVSCAGSAGSFSDKNVGTGKTVTASVALSGADSGNYSVAATATTSANITAKSVTPSVTASDKVYDGTNSASTTCALAGVLAGDAGNVSCSAASATFSDASAGNGKTVSATGISLSGSEAGNYSLSSTTASTTANITKMAVTPSVTASDKVYDGNTTASTTCTLAGVLAGDAGNVSCSAASASFADANVGSGKTVSATGISLSGTASGNYALSSTTATATANITAKSVTPSVTASNKVYDGTNSASTTCTLAGVLAGDAGNVSCSAASASFANANTGTGKTVTATGISLSGTASGNYALSSTTATASADITAKSVTAAVAAANKVYDGSASASITSCTLTGVLAADSSNVTCSAASASFANANTGTGKTVTATGISLSGTASGNYALSSTTATASADITARPVTASITASNKVYDGTAAATIATCSLSGVVGADPVTCTGSAGAFSDANVGTAKPVSATVSLSGAAAGNYTLTSTTAATTANITAKSVTASITASNKTYDGTTTATVSGCTLSGVVGSDDVSCAGSGGTFASASVGNGKTVTATVALSGTAAGNYALSSTTATTTANITGQSVTASVTAANKVYNGNTAATVTGCTLTGVLGSDDVTCTGSGATFASAAADTGKTVTATVSLSGAQAGNYTLSSTTATTTASITPKPVTPSITASNKSYDGTTAATATCSLAGVVGADPVTCTASGAAFSDANAGAGKTVTATVSLSGAAAGNYALTATSASTTATILPAVTSTALASSANPSNYGQAVTFTVTETAGALTPTGTVSFYNQASGASCAALGTSTLIDTQPLALGTAATSTSALATGSNPILACYSGDANYASSSATLAQTVTPAPVVSLNPTSLSFGNQLAGTSSSPVPVTLTNIGTAALTPITITITGPNASFFTKTTTCGASLAAGANCKVNVTFSPTASGVATAVLTLTDNDKNVAGSQQFIQLTGAGTSSITGGSLYSYGIFATASGCGAITATGNGSLDSFDSTLGYNASHMNSGGNAGTNGNATLSGNAKINGTVASPLSGTGACKASSMMGYTVSGNAKATGGLVHLDDPVFYANPVPPSPAPPTTNQSISGTCGSIAGCTSAGSKAVNLAPGQYGNLSLSGNTTAHLTRGTYNVNSLTLSGNSVLRVDSGPVVMNVAGTSVSNTALDLSGGSVLNPSGIPINMQFYYGGSKATKLSGNAQTYSVVYAPNSAINLSGGSDFFGSIIGNTINMSGNTNIHYDRHLPSITAGDYLWFNSEAVNVANIPSSGAKLYVTNATITINGGAPISVPNAVVNFSSTATSATTSWDLVNSRWSTVVPRATVNGSATIHTFLDGLALLVPAGGFPNGIESMTWSAAFSTDSPGVTFQWQWGAAEYTSFSAVYGNGTNNNLLGVVPVDGTDPAGTPSSYKASLTDGGTGGGGASWTGFPVGVAGVAPTIAPASVAPSSLGFGAVTVGVTSASMPVVLTNNQAVSLTITSVTASGDFAQTNNCPAVLAGGGSCTINVTFTPTIVGARTGKVTINDNANNSPQTASLTGSGE